MKEKDKEIYVAPHSEVIEIESEGILCASGNNIYGESDRWGGSWGDDF